MPLARRPNTTEFEGVTYRPRHGLIMYAVRIVTLALTAAAARADAAALAMFSSLIVWVVKNRETPELRSPEVGISALQARIKG